MEPRDRLAARPETDAEVEIDLLEYARLAWRHRWVLLAVTVSCAAIGFLGTRFSRPMYQATVRLLLPADAAALTLPTFRALVQAPSVARTVVEEYHLDREWAIDDAEFLARVSVEAVPETNFVSVGMTLPDPTAAAKAANRVGELAVEAAKRFGAETGRKASRALEAEVREASAGLERAGAALEALRKESKIEFLQREMASLLQVRDELAELQLDIESEKARLAQAEQEVARRQAGAEGGRTAEAPDRADLDALRQEALSARSRLAYLEQRRAARAGFLKAADPRSLRVFDLYASEARIARSQTDYQVAEEVYIEAAKRLEQRRVQLAAAEEPVVVAEPAVAPVRPLPRPAGRGAVIAGLAGLTVSLLGVLLVELIGKLRARGRGRQASTLA